MKEREKTNFLFSSFLNKTMVVPIRKGYWIRPVSFWSRDQSVFVIEK